MIIVREHFIAKPGQASKLAALLKETMQITGQAKTRVMTDITGNFNQVVMETEAESLADFETRMKEYVSNSGIRQQMSGYTDMYLTGGREIFRVV